MVLHIKRVYEPTTDGDGKRILVDRLWPRGLGKTEAHVDLWLKDVAPSPDLRRWFEFNPIVELIDAGRGILMRAQWPDWTALGRVALVSLALYAL